MLHRHLEIEERYLLHPRMLDVLEALIGPDVMAMQTMYFVKAPGGRRPGLPPGLLLHPHLPGQLCGAWIAVDRADEENGCVWFTPARSTSRSTPPRRKWGRTTPTCAT